MYDLSTNIFKKTIQEDPRGQIIVIPYLKLDARSDRHYIDVSFHENHERELYILDTSATSVRKYLDRIPLGLGRGLPIRKDRSIIPSIGEYAPVTDWPGKEEQNDLLALLRAMVIFKTEFCEYNPLLQKLETHPPGFRYQIRERAALLLRRSPYMYKGITLDFRIWLDNLGSDHVNGLLVSFIIS